MRFETTPAVELQGVINEICSIEATMRTGRGVHRWRLVALLERKAELERELEVSHYA
jgi:hypothetical protein